MKRRDAMAVLSGAMLSWPFLARANQRLPLVGFLRSATSTGSQHIISGLIKGLADAGYTEGTNVAVSFLFAESGAQPPDMAAELVKKGADVIVANTPAALAARSVTSTTPIVFVAGDDPVRLGLVSSLNQPGGNITGISFIDTALTAKRLELLLEVAPGAHVVGAILGRGPEGYDFEAAELEATARMMMGREIVIARAMTEDAVERAFDMFAGRGVGAVLIGSGAGIGAMRRKIIPLAAKHALPAIYSQRASADAGGLMSYGANIAQMYWQAGAYASRILRGERPADMPVSRPTQFELVLNLRTAKALGLNISPDLLVRADDFID